METPTLPVDQKPNLTLIHDREKPHVKSFLTTYLGTVPYTKAVKLQLRLVQERTNGKIPDVLLLLQHPPVFTTGKFRGEDDFIASRYLLRGEGIQIVHTNRGGSITYHGPGQLVGYPIFNLKDLGIGIREYVSKLEDSLIQVLISLGIQGERCSGYPGVWVGKAKICSIGINVNRSVTMHGFALNVDNDLSYFDYINPCGIKGIRMTSIAKTSGHSFKCKDIIPYVTNALAISFGIKSQQWDSSLINMNNG
jgi:lipoate-protein ligase B